MTFARISLGLSANWINSLIKMRQRDLISVWHLMLRLSLSDERAGPGDIHFRTLIIDVTGSIHLGRGEKLEIDGNRFIYFFLSRLLFFSFSGVS